MNYSKEDNGSQTFWEHWGGVMFLVPMIIGLVVATSFEYLTAMEWLYLFCAATVLLLSGGGLIAHAKVPVYRRGEFFTFGTRTVPQELRACYRWGWRMFLLGVALMLFLQLWLPLRHS